LHHKKNYQMFLRENTILQKSALLRRKKD
jgi:hypothetical protein